MTREKLFKIFNSNGFYIAFSIFAAICLWTYVSFLQKDTISSKFVNVPVVVTGQETLENKGFIATSVNVEKIDLTITGKTSEVMHISGSELYVEVDLKDLAETNTSVGVYQLSYTVHYPDNINPNYVSVESASADYVTVKIEKFSTKTIPVKVVYDAVVPEGYRAEPIEIKQENLVISGPDSVVSRISYAQVIIEEQEITDTFSGEFGYVYMSEDNEYVESELVTANYDKISVTIPVVMIKEIPLALEFTGINSANLNNTVCEISPSKIQVSGSPSVIEDLNEIIIGTLDLTTFAEEYENDIEIVLPEGITNLSEETTASVSVKITGLSTKEITVSNFAVKNNTESYSAEVLTESIILTLRGKSGALDDVSASDITVYADLSSLGNATGTYNVPAVVEIKNADGVDAVGKYNVTVRVKETD